MIQLILKEDILEEVKKDQTLFGKVASALGVSVLTAYRRIPKNNPDIATATVLQTIANHLTEKTGKKVKVTDLVSELQPVA